MQNRRINLSDEHIQFIEEEFGILRDELMEISKEKWHDIRTMCFDIELDETTEEDCSERGEMASDIVSIKYSQLFS